jgi:hypothetical protein
MNPFLAFAEKQTSPAAKVRQLAAERRRLTAAEKAATKALAEREDLFRLYKKQRRQRLDELLAGPHRAAAQELIAFLKTMLLEDEARLIEVVHAAGWVRADINTKFEVLSLVDAALVGLRERDGLPPFSDPLPHQTPSAFLVIREMFR